MLQNICIAVYRQNGNRVKNAFIAVFVTNCLQNGDSVKNMLQVACMAACFKNGDWDDKSLV